MHSKIFATLLVLALVPLLANAGETTTGPYTIRYNALSANVLPQATTDKLGIRRASDQGMLNITVLKGEGAKAASVPAQVTGKATTLTGSRVAISFRQITDSGGQSWIGSFKIPGNDTLRFDLDVTPKGGPETNIQFTHDYIID